MWCYQKPGFEALLLAELQKQQQCTQFCDTLLKTEGVSVPAHSCVLSALSPHISSALSSTPPPPAGQSRLLEFQALGACSLLHVVRLLYSGEMAGEGEREKQEAISAAAKLGIHGLVEVTKRDRKGRNEDGEGRRTEVGVQTEPPMPDKSEGGRSRWRREVRDGSIFLWKDTLTDGRNDTWTQTEEQQVNTAAPSHPAASFETIDMASLQSLRQTDPNLLPPQIPYFPISLIYPPDESQTHQPSSAPLLDSMQESTASGHTSVAALAPQYTPVATSLVPFPSRATLCAADPQSWWAGPQAAARDVAVAEEWEDERFEQFQGNIPGYISYFLNPDKEEGSRGGRARRRQGAGVGGARKAGTGEKRARRPRGRTGGRGRGGFTQTVDVQEVGVSRLQKLFLQRWGMRASRTGQGGGAAGRKLYLKTRDLLKRRRGRGKVWELSQDGDVKEGGGGNTQRGRRNTKQQVMQSQDGRPVGRAPMAKATPTTSVSFSSPPMRFYNVHTLPASTPSVQPSPSPAASYVSPASSLLHTTSLRLPAPPPHEEQPEHIDRLLEEVMMGLDILPNKDNGAPHSHPPLPTSSISCTYVSSGSILAQNKQPARTTGLPESGPGFCGSTQVVAVSRVAGGSSSANGEVPVLQQQGEGELNEMLDHFLQSFEQHVDSCTAREEVEMGGQSCTQTTTAHLQSTRTPRPVRRSKITKLQHNDEAKTPLNHSQPRKARAGGAIPPKHTEGTPGKDRAPAKRRKKRRKNEYLFSLEKKRVRVRKPVSSSDAKFIIVHDLVDKQLQQMPVVKLERSSSLPGKVTLHGLSCQSLEVKSSSQTKTSSSSVKCPHDSLSNKNLPVLWSTKTYPIRSRFREAHIVDSRPFLEEPSLQIYKCPPSAPQTGRRPGRPRKNGQLLSLSNGESSKSPIQPQPVEPRGMDEKQGNSQERHEEEFTVKPQEEAEGPTRRGKKRAAESDRETSDDATLTKRVCFEQMAQPTSETRIPRSASADFVSEPATTEVEDVIDVETVLLTSVGDCLQREKEKEKPVWREIKLRETEEPLMDEEMESSGDEIIDVDGDAEDGHQGRAAPTLSHFVEVKPSVSSPSRAAKAVSLGSTGSCEEDKDEDIDVMGGSSPVPDPVIISWTESSEGEEEEGYVDVVGEKTDYATSSVFATTSKGELVNRKYHIISH